MDQDSFKDFVLDRLGDVPALGCKGMFGGFGLYAGAKFFGIIFKGRLYFKTDDATRAQYVERGMEHFQPNEKQELSSFHEVPPDIIERADEIVRWAQQAVDAASSRVMKTRTKRIIRKTLSLIAAWVLFAARVSIAATNGAATLPELQARLGNQVADERFSAAMWGVKVVSLDTGKAVFEHNARKLFSPASNCKLYTVAMALDKLGGDYRIKTSLYANAKPDQRGNVPGDLILYGRGDPLLTARLHGGDIFSALQPLVAALTNAGVKRIAGDLVGDESFFHGSPFGSGWVWDDFQNYYGAEISALTINDNTLQITVSPGARAGERCKLVVSLPTTQLVLSNRTTTVATNGLRAISILRPVGENVVYVSGTLPEGDRVFVEEVAFSRPALVFAELFSEALARNGVKVDGKSRAVNWLDRQASPLELTKLVELGSIGSQPMRDIAREIQKPSQNLYTDLVLAHIGAGQTEASAGDATSEDVGIRELEKFLKKAGVRSGDVRFEEGSGLSRNNLTTPDATIALLQFMNRHAESRTYFDALPVAGVDGTLKNRFKNTVAEGNVRAKTGTLRWASSISGHATTAAGERWIFCIMLNRYAAPDVEHSARAELDRMVLELAGCKARSNE